MPLISIIVPCYNSEAFVGRTLESVRRQRLSDWELIVVDDGSTDESPAIIAAAAAADARIRLIRQANAGVCRARNAGFAASSAESRYLLFLDADDCPYSEMLAVLSEYLETHPYVAVAYCSYLFTDEQDRPIDTIYLPRYAASRWGVRELRDDEPRTPFHSILCESPVLPSASLLRRSVYERTEGWDEILGQHCEDTDVMLQMALHGEVHYIPRILYQYRRHSQNSSDNIARFHSQQQKLLAKWRGFRGESPEQTETVQAALRFREQRLTPYLALRAGTQYLRQRMVGKATRYYLGGLRRYLAAVALR